MKKILLGLSVFFATLISAQNYPDYYPNSNNNNGGYYSDYDDEYYFPDDYYYQYPSDYYTTTIIKVTTMIIREVSTISIGTDSSGHIDFHRGKSIKS